MKVALFANDYVGLEICRFLVASGDHIVKLYIHGDPAKRKMTQEIISASGCAEKDIEMIRDLDSAGQESLRAAAPDFIITVYWAYLLNPEVVRTAKLGTINFHPAFLPINRGWYPHVHSIIDGTPTGVTLHALAEAADTGDVWAQKLVPLLETDTAGDIYRRLQGEIIALFKESWPEIKSGKVKPSPQDESKAKYHKKKEVEGLDFLDPDSIMSARDVINRLRARTFGKKAFAYFLGKDGRKIYVKIQLSYSDEFE